MSVKWKPTRKEAGTLTTESLLAKSPSGVFRFWDGEAGRGAVREKKTDYTNLPTEKRNGRTRGSSGGGGGDCGGGSIRDWTDGIAPEADPTLTSVIRVIDRRVAIVQSRWQHRGRSAAVLLRGGAIGRATSVKGGL